MQTSVRKFFVVVLGVFFSLTPTQSASAHTELVNSQPAAAEVLTNALDRFEVTFSEPPMAEGFGLVLTDEMGTEISTNAPEIKGTSLVMNWPVNLPNGSYRLNYRVVAEDGHVVSGQIAFELQDLSQSSPADSSVIPTPALPTAQATTTDLIAPVPTTENSSVTNSWVWLILTLVISVIAIFFIVSKRQK